MYMCTCHETITPHSTGHLLSVQGNWLPYSEMRCMGDRFYYFNTIGCIRDSSDLYFQQKAHNVMWTGPSTLDPSTSDWFGAPSDQIFLTSICKAYSKTFTGAIIILFFGSFLPSLVFQYSAFHYMLPSLYLLVIKGVVRLLNINSHTK